MVHPDLNSGHESLPHSPSVDVSKAKGKILVIRGGAIGDFILTVPVFQQLRKYVPSTHLEILGYPRVAKLAVDAGWADACKSIEEPELVRFFAPSGVAPAQWLSYFSQFDIIISYLFDPDGFFRNNIQQSGKHHYIQGPHRPDDRGQLHATDALLQPLEKLAVYETGLIPDLTRLGRHGGKTESGKLHVALHPGSGSPSKNWPLGHWLKWVEQMVMDCDCHFILVAGEADREAAQSLTSAIPAARRTLMLNCPLEKVAQQLAGCDLFVGHDTGISHLAAAMAIPSLVIWGPTNLEVWQPRGRHVTIIESDEGLAGITPDQINREARRLIEMQP